MNAVVVRDYMSFLLVKALIPKMIIDFVGKCINLKKKK